MKSRNSFLSERQIEVLKLRRQGLIQRQVADRLKTTRENVSILESRAHRNIERAIATLEILEEQGISTHITIMPKKHILEVPKIILREADKATIKINSSLIEILELVKLRARSKIVNKHIVKPISVTILPDGKLTVE